MNYTIVIFLSCILPHFVYSMETTIPMVEESLLIKLRKKYETLRTKHKIELLGFSRDVLEESEDGSINLDIKNLNGETLLEAAARTKNWNLVKLLLECNVNVSLQRIVYCPEPCSAETTLHYAVQDGQLGVVELLLDKGALVDCRSFNNSTPLILATQAFMRTNKKVFKDIIANLIRNNASIDAENKEGQSFSTLVETSQNKQLLSFLPDHIQAQRLSPKKKSQPSPKKRRLKESE